MVKASEKFVRLIVRRPHAYQLLAKGKNVPIPGIVFLDTEGKLIGTARLEEAKKLVEKMNEVTK